MTKKANCPKTVWHFKSHEGRITVKNLTRVSMGLFTFILAVMLSVVALAAQPIQITNDSADDYHAKWSPDGSRILFTSRRGGKVGLWMITPEGDSLTPVETDLDGDHHISWSPDGKRIVFDAYPASGPPPSLWTMPIGGGKPKRVTSYPGPEFQPSWSPNDSLFAFASLRSGNTDVWVRPVAGGEPRQITDDPATDCHPIWSPDGTRLSFTSDRSGNQDIWIVSVKDGKAKQLTTDQARDDQACWSPDGSMIAFTSDRSGKDDIWIVSVEGGEPRRLTWESRNGWPNWSPNGRRIVFSSHRGGNPDLWIMEVQPETHNDADSSRTNGSGDE
jgi:TolB protein